MLRRKREVVASDMETLLCREGRMRPDKIADRGGSQPSGCNAWLVLIHVPEARVNVMDAGHW